MGVAIWVAVIDFHVLIVGTKFAGTTRLRSARVTLSTKSRCAVTRVCASLATDASACQQLQPTPALHLTQVRYTVFVRPEFEGCLESVTFAIEGPTGLSKSVVRRCCEAAELCTTLTAAAALVLARSPRRVPSS